VREGGGEREGGGREGERRESMCLRSKINCIILEFGQQQAPRLW
jgi:hypothetical protein